MCIDFVEIETPTLFKTTAKVCLTNKLFHYWLIAATHSLYLHLLTHSGLKGIYCTHQETGQVLLTASKPTTSEGVFVSLCSFYLVNALANVVVCFSSLSSYWWWVDSIGTFSLLVAIEMKICEPTGSQSSHRCESSNHKLPEEIESDNSFCNQPTHHTQLSIPLEWIHSIPRST